MPTSPEPKPKTRKQRAVADARRSKKAAARKAPARRRAVPEPTGNVAKDPEDYLAMVDVLLKVVPAKSPGMPTGKVFDEVKARTSRKRFPGDTHRMWARQVMADLKAKGVLVETGPPARWHLR